MNNFNTNYQKRSRSIDNYLNCLSYCDIFAKGIDYNCERICKEKYLNLKQRNPNKITVKNI